MFLKDNKLLIDKPRKRETYKMIGGKLEKGKLHFKEQLENAMKN